MFYVFAHWHVATGSKSAGLFVLLFVFCPQSFHHEFQLLHFGTRIRFTAVEGNRWKYVLHPNCDLLNVDWTRPAGGVDGASVILCACDSVHHFLFVLSHSISPLGDFFNKAEFEAQIKSHI